MGRNKFEDQIRTRLSEREITPSEESWEKLSGQLSSEDKKRGPKLWWLGIAATILGAVFIAGMIYNNNPEIDGPGVVETPVEIKNDVIKEYNNVQKPATEVNIASDSPAKKDQLVQPKNGNFNPVENIRQNTSSIAEIKSENLKPEDEDLLDLNEDKISKKLEEIIAEISSSGGAPGDVTYDEVDALLYKAASEISMERTISGSTGTVNADDLLFAVEMELEESFREKVFELLKESFQKARTAVANRNYP